jgi:methionyl-tRNA synthetase
MEPRHLCDTSTKAIEQSMAALGLSMTGLPPIDDTYRATVTDFFVALHDAGKLSPRTVRLPYASRSGTYLYDGLMTGTCPSCLAGSSGGVCEGCGHPNNFDELLSPSYVLDPSDPVTYREATVLVLPMENYRDRLVAYFAARERVWRPHSMQLIRELLAGPLPEVPITIPGRWGVAAPFRETPGQILYPWVEAMPAVMYSTWWAAAQRGERAEHVDEFWRAEHDADLVYFHGFDNVYHWGLMDLVMLLAHEDRYSTPAGNISNEFYNLAGDKFSTSRDHVIWCSDLTAEVPRDLVRFYLSLTAPEHQKTDFSVEALRDVAGRRLVRPWNKLAETVSRLMSSGGELAVSADAKARAAIMADRFRACYALDGFSTSRAAEMIVSQVSRLCATADGDPDPGDLLFEVQTLLAWAAPILIDATSLAAGTGADLSLDPDAPAWQRSAVDRFTLPVLPSPELARTSRRTPA